MGMHGVVSDKRASEHTSIMAMHGVLLCLPITWTTGGHAWVYVKRSEKLWRVG